MARQTWKDMNGRKHVAHTVRVCNHDGWGNPLFCVLHIYTNTLVDYDIKTREEAWERLRQIEEGKS